MSTLNYPSIIHFYGFSLPSKSDHCIQIYTDYLSNGNLFNALKHDETLDDDSKILTPTLRSIIVYGTVSGMCYLHKNNIIHRDLKPENIFLDKNYYPIISDFGLSRFISNELVMTRKLGTPYFMAPELLYDDSKKITNKIDVYAFGVTLLTFFTTSYKFYGAQPREIIQLVNNILNGKRYVIPKGTPEYYVQLIKRCWAEDIDVRPSFKDILNEFNSSDDFIFEGSDKNQVHKYMKTLNQDDDKSKQNKSSDDDDEETKEFDFN